MFDLILNSANTVIENENTSSGSIVLRIVVISIIVLFAVLITVTVLMIVKPDIFRKRSKEEEMGVDFVYDSDTSAKVGDSKSFLPYEEINEMSLDMGNYNYRAILEVSSVNYDLMSATEQEMVDAAFKQFLNSLDFPIEIYIQTREFDYQRVVDDLQARSKNAMKKYPQLEDYFNEYIYEMSGITERFGNSKIKKKYVIVPFDNSDLQDVSELSDAEINEFALESLYLRCNTCAAGLGNVGLDVQLLRRPQIAEVLYSYYHRDYFRIAEDITNGALTSLVINGPDHRADDRYKLDSILSAAQTSIRTRLVKATSTEEELMFYRYIVDELEKFKQDDLPKTIAELMRDSFETAKEHGLEDDYYAYGKAHPEARFWSEETHDYNEGNITIPEEEESGFKEISKAKQTLGNKVQDDISYGEFNPEEY